MKSKPFQRFTRKEPGERIRTISMTEPAQVQPLEKLLNLRAIGAPVPYFNGVFSDRDTPDIFKMDSAEILQLREETRELKEAAEADIHALNKRYESLHQEKVESLAKQAEARRKELQQEAEQPTKKSVHN